MMTLNPYSPTKLMGTNIAAAIMSSEVEIKSLGCSLTFVFDAIKNCN